MRHSRTLVWLLISTAFCLASCAASIKQQLEQQLRETQRRLGCLTALCEASYLDRGYWPKNIYELTDWSRSHGYRFDPERYGHTEFQQKDDGLHIEIDQPNSTVSSAGYRGTLVVTRPTVWPTTQLSMCEKL